MSTPEPLTEQELADISEQSIIYEDLSRCVDLSGCDFKRLLATIRSRDARILDLENSLIAATDATYMESQND